jgi:hypothetical protein
MTIRDEYVPIVVFQIDEVKQICPLFIRQSFRTTMIGRTTMLSLKTVDEILVTHGPPIHIRLRIRIQKVGLNSLYLFLVIFLELTRI